MLNKHAAGGLTTVLLLALCLLHPASGRADGINLNRFTPAETASDGFYLSRPDAAGHLQPGAVLWLNYANDPLVLEVDQGDTDSESGALVSDHLMAHVGGSLGLWDRVVLYVAVDANVLMEGDDLQDQAFGAPLGEADGAGLGDGRVGGRVVIVGDRDDLFALAGQLTATLPLGQWANGDQNFSGEGNASVTPELIAELRLGKLRITGNLGSQLREDVDLGSASVQDELSFAVGGTFAVTSRLDALLEAYGTSSFAEFGSREGSPLEALAGGRYWLSDSWNVGLGGGAGLQRGVGAPDMRIVATVGVRTVEPPPKVVEQPRGIPDTDGDGLLDPDDGCPEQPEDKDGFEDADGCPDPDNDQDLIADVDDECPLDPEDMDTFEDEDGCPDPDNDKDERPDVSDRCPLQPEDIDGFEDEDGCPDPDNDNDGIPDVDDECPMEPGTVDGNGCPTKIRVEGDRIIILDRVEFATSKDVILERSTQILQEVRATLAANPDIRKLRVEGHTDSRGNKRKNLDLSRRRARSVVRWLVEHEIAAERFEAWGCGHTVAIEDNKTKSGRQANRRVEFRIIDPAPTDAAELPKSCKQIDL